ncbi:MAG: type III pantothenate kinase [Spirochaetota bacterium]
MLLAIDIGNTDIVCGVFEGRKLLSTFRMRSQAGKTQDEYAASLNPLLAERGHALVDIQRSVMSSVVPALSPIMAGLCLRLFGAAPTVLGPALYGLLPLRLPSPRQIGTDLVANALAAFSTAGGAAIVADFGTALSFTAVAADGRVLGVAIAPGIATAVSSLTRNTAQLPEVELEAPPQVIGTDTVMSIQAGVMHGYAGLVMHLVSMMKAEMGFPAIVIATGGLCGKIAPLVDCFDRIDMDLTLQGLAIVAEYT